MTRKPYIVPKEPTYPCKGSCGRTNVTPGDMDELSRRVYDVLGLCGLCHHLVPTVLETQKFRDLAFINFWLSANDINIGSV